MRLAATCSKPPLDQPRPFKYIVSHPAVTCCVPGTARVEYLLDNLGAAQGRLPDAVMRRQMEELIDRL
jgi:aryl-alcohol dehydrogenase-like predicted oxidoreductase